jgi:hypothetical protein
MPLSTYLDFKLRLLSTKAGSGSTPTDDYFYPLLLKLASGSGAAQANKSFHDTIEVPNGDSYDLDLSGVLVDALGQTLAATKIKLLVLHNRNGIANNVIEVGGAASHAWEAWTDNPGSTFTLKSGGLFVYYAPNTDAPAVTGGTGDILTLTNPGATDIDVEVAIAGV